MLATALALLGCGATKSGSALGAGGTTNSPQQEPTAGSAGETTEAEPLLPSEYWIRRKDSESPIHVRVTSPTTAVVSEGGLAYDFAIESSTQTLGFDPIPAMYDAPSVRLRGPTLLRAVDAKFDSIAISAPHAGKLGGEAMVLDGRIPPGCLMGGVDWIRSDATVEPDESETEIALATELTPLGAVPWESLYLRTNKPAKTSWSSDARATLASGQDIDMVVSPNDERSVSFANWADAMGSTVTLSGRLANTNGAGADGMTEWALPIQFLDFGSTHTGALDFSQPPAEGSSTWTSWGGAEQVENDESCSSETRPDARACLRLPPGSGVALRIQGPLSGLRFVGHSLSFVSPAMFVRVDLAAANQEPQFAAYPETRLDSVIDEAFAVIRVSPTFNPQTDSRCAQPLPGDFLLYAIEPIAP